MSDLKDITQIRPDEDPEQAMERVKRTFDERSRCHDCGGDASNARRYLYVKGGQFKPLCGPCDRRRQK